MNFDEIFAQAETIVGAPTKEELKLLYDCALQFPSSTTLVVEIGCDQGKSTSVLAEVAKDRNYMLYTVDDFSYEDGKYREVFEANMARLGLGRYIVLVESKSKNAASSFIDNSINLLFIDGDHSAKGVDTDCRLWLPKLRNGGIVLFHDYEPQTFKPLMEVVDKHTGSWETVGQARVMLARRKP